jgi:CheY-like chemotaxis protein
MQEGDRVRKSGTKKSSAAPAPEASGKAPRQVRLLVVEDSDSSRAAICEHLREEQFDFEEAENGAIALQKFKAARFDLILMDIRMPTMDGYEAMRQIRQWEQSQGLTRTPIIAFSASSFEEDVQRAVENGADLHVAKPVKREALAAAIRSQLHLDAEETESDGKQSVSSRN